MFRIFTASAYLLLAYCILSVVSSSEGETHSLVVHRFTREASSKKDAIDGWCKVPPPLRHGQYTPSRRRCRPHDDDPISPFCSLTPGTYVPPNWPIFFTCDPDFKLNTTKTVAVCLDGQWKPGLPACLGAEFCPPLRSQFVNVKCTRKGKEVSCEAPMRPKTVAKAECKQYYKLDHEPDSMELTCLDSGEWSHPLIHCVPGEDVLVGSCVLGGQNYKSNCENYCETHGFRRGHCGSFLKINCWCEP